MKAKHRILAAGMAAAMTLSLAACGGSASTAEPTASSAVETVTPEATSEAASGDVTEVTWWTYFGDKNIGYLQNIIDDFNNTDTGPGAVSQTVLDTVLQGAGQKIVLVPALPGPQ